MIKHWLEFHENEEMEKDRFGVKVLKYTRTSFERQILESVIIQEEKSKSNLLNSKSEFNRCAVPRLASKLGEKIMEKEEKIERK